MNPCAIQKDLDGPFGRLDEHFPFGVLAHILSEKIKAFIHVRDNRLRRREVQQLFRSQFYDLLIEALINKKQSLSRPYR